MGYYKFGIIASHVSEGFSENRQSQVVSMPWGEIKVYTGLINGADTAVILRCGDHADMASHLVNFRSNTWGLEKLGVKQIISRNAISSCNPYIRPGDFMVSNDAMDFIKKRILDFFEDHACWVKVNVSGPFCGNLRRYFLEIRADERIPVYSTGTSICTEGPRFETPTEVRYYGSIRGDIMGTPMLPELVLAREAGVCYTSLSMVINMYTGTGPAIYQNGDKRLMAAYERNGVEDRVKRVLRNLTDRLPEEADCLRAGLPEKGFFGIGPEWRFQYKCR